MLWKQKNAYVGVEETRHRHTALVGGRHKKSRVLSRKMVISGWASGLCPHRQDLCFFFLLYSVMSSNHPHLLLLQNILWALWIHLMILLRKIPGLPEGVLPWDVGKHTGERDLNLTLVLRVERMSSWGHQRWIPGDERQRVVLGLRINLHPAPWLWPPERGGVWDAEKKAVGSVTLAAMFRALDWAAPWEERGFFLMKLWWLACNIRGVTLPAIGHRAGCHQP